jgi:hypothetical protein
VALVRVTILSRDVLDVSTLWRKAERGSKGELIRRSSNLASLLSGFKVC